MTETNAGRSDAALPASYYDLNPSIIARERRIGTAYAGVGLAFIEAWLRGDKETARFTIEMAVVDDQVETPLLSALRLIAGLGGRVVEQLHGVPCNGAGVMQMMAFGEWAEVTPDSIFLLSEALTEPFGHDHPSVVDLPAGISAELFVCLARDVVNWVVGKTDRTVEDVFAELRCDLAAALT